MHLGHVVPWILRATVLLQYVMDGRKGSCRLYEHHPTLSKSLHHHCLYKEDYSMLPWEYAHRHRPVSILKLGNTENISQGGVTLMAGVGVLSDIRAGMYMRMLSGAKAGAERGIPLPRPPILSSSAC